MLEEEGKDEEAEELIEKPVVVAPVAIDNKPKATGISTKKIWKARVVDLRVLVQAIADDKAPLMLIAVSEPALNEMARAMGADMNVPGVEAYQKTVVSARI